MDNATITGMLFSCLGGYNIYVPSKYDPQSMLHLLSNTDVTIRPVTGMEPALVEEKWRYFVERPIDIKNVLWPVDIVHMTDRRMGLIFRKRAFPKMESLKTLLYNSVLLSWNRPEIKKLVTNLLSVFHEMHAGGYAYHAFDMDLMYFNHETNEVLLDFSLGMSRHFNDRTHVENVDGRAIAIEFLPPWIPFEEKHLLTLSDDYYSIAAMLFRLLIGRMPYQGRLMDGRGDMMDALRDVDPADHMRMFEHYHANPVFIFDPNNKSNGIGSYTNEEKFIDRWEDLPEEIRKMFIKTFSPDNVTLPYDKKELYSAKEWLDALQANGVI